MYNNYEIIRATHRDQYGSFVKKNHYTKSLARGCKYVFILYINNKVYGVAMYGVPTSRNAKNRYGNNLVELKRFCLHESCVKNTASWFIAKTIKLLPKHTQILSYADQNQHHEGTIYKAANFTYIGETKKTQYGVVKGIKRKYHLRDCYQKVNGTYTKTAFMFKEAMRTGDAKLLLSKPKHIYLYQK